MKISLIIPAYNEEKFIEETVKIAIENSQGKFHEIIVVDNNSTDKTREILNKIPNIKVIEETRKGVAFARQIGFEKSTGEILAYIDSDTHITNGWYEKIEEEFKNEKLACISGPYDYYDLNKIQTLGTALYWYVAKLIYFFVGYMAVGGNFAIRKSVLEKMNGFDLSKPFYGDDTDLSRRASKFGKVKFDLSFRVETSGRRLLGQGFLNTTIHYTSNFFSEVFFHTPVTKKYKDFR